MKINCILVLLLLSTSGQLLARNDIHSLPFYDVVERGIDEGLLDPDIKFYLHGQSHSAVVENFGEYKSNKKTNAFGKSDKKACDWVLLAVLKTYQARAKSLGANAVINLKSNYKNREYVDPDNYQCGAGAILAGVAMKGEVVKL